MTGRIPQRQIDRNEKSPHYTDTPNSKATMDYLGGEDESFKKNHEVLVLLLCLKQTNSQLIKCYKFSSLRTPKNIFLKNAKIKKSFIVLFCHQECGACHIPTE
jgi:hypothetical protein